jgi:hypothetical protein
MDLSTWSTPRAMLAEGTAVVALATSAHLSFWWTMPPILWQDSARYIILSSNLPHRLSTANWDLFTVPVYPLFLWLVGHWTRSLATAVGVQQLLAVATCLFVWLSARRLFGARPAMMGAILIAISPFRHYYGQALLSEHMAELLLATAFALLTVGIGSSAVRLNASRPLAGLALGLAVLTRPNLVPAAVVGMALPAAPREGTPICRWLLAMLVTGSAVTLAVAPWLVFNAQRGVNGLTANAGYAVNAFANELGVGTPIDLEALSSTYTTETDRRLVQIALRRFTSAPMAYLRAVGRTAIALFIPLFAKGDVAPNIGLCHTPPEIWRTMMSAWPLAAEYSVPHEIRTDRWRCAFHRALMTPLALLITIGWIGLGVWAGASLASGRIDLALLAWLPLACATLLCLMLQANTRYAFPFEALAVGVGVPAGISLLRRRMMG